MALVSMPRTLPWDWYVDPGVLRLEQTQIFERFWQYAARADQVAAPGSFAATFAGHVPVVVVRGKDGALRAFVNVCRHRGHLLCDGHGRRETIQCPYHAWTYDLDGRLRAAPRADREPGFDADALGLVPVAAEAWGPFVFVNPDPEATPLAEQLGELPRLLAAGGLDLDSLAVLEARRGGRVRRQLEDLRRELPRVLPLLGRPSEPLEGDRRGARRVHARDPQLVPEPVRPPRDGGGGVTTPSARSSAGSSTSCSRTRRST